VNKTGSASMDKIINPHDKLFRETWSDLATAKSFLVLYHGPSGRSPVDTCLSSLINGPTEGLAAYIPDFNYVLYDLTRFSDDQIKGTVMARVTMLLFKHISDPQVREKLSAVLSLLVELSEKQTVPQYFETIFRYIINNIDDVSVDDLAKIAKESLSEKQGDMVMTLAEKLHKEGFDKGMQKGIQKGMQKGMQEGLQEGLRQGLLEAIEVAVSLKFSHEAFKIMPMVYQVSNTNLLKTIKSAVMTAKEADELVGIIKDLD
jgi:hypothetical protein